MAPALLSHALQFPAAPACRNSFDAQFAHPHANVLGVNVSALNLKAAVDLADRWIARGDPGYACMSSVHGIMEAHRDPEFCRIVNQAVIAAPDGMPLSWIGHLQGFRDMDRVFGPDFMLAMCRLSVKREYRHFLYGGQPGVAQHLSTTLQEKFPGIQIVGTYTPPFRELTSREEEDLADQVHRARPHVLWVGISTPKQDRFMARYFERLQVPLLVGVGAAFDYHTGRIRDCSDWAKRAGLQWLHRLMQDPRRLWRRYLYSNSAFLWQIGCQLSGLRKYPVEDDQHVFMHDGSSGKPSCVPGRN